MKKMNVAEANQKKESLFHVLSENCRSSSLPFFFLKYILRFTHVSYFTYSDGPNQASSLSVF
jgi:hypothetical protein